ncbi:MAG: DUF559 domain-containing protein [Thermoleophilaceae bacterium]|nr:DUF559 domain-containing protein [Thermoleophilaceae bacterium]
MEVPELATRQHGVVALAQLVELGLGPRVVENAVSSGRLYRIHRGVFAVGHRKLTWDGWCMAGVLACGPGALLSHRPAGAQWEVARYAGNRIEVSVAGGGRRPRPGIVLHQPRALAPQDRAEIDGIPVTSLARTFLDLAATFVPRRLQRAMEEGEHRQLLDLRAIEDVIVRNQNHPGRAQLSSIAAVSAPLHLTRSEVERAFIELCYRYGIPEPAMNLSVEGYEVDAHWTEQRLIVEIDTVAFHASRAAFERDRERDAALTLAGWRVIRITDTRIAREPETVAALVRGLLGEE